MMKILGVKDVEVVSEVMCDICCRSTQTEGGGLQYGELWAAWGYGSSHDGERYEVHLCECCFFEVLANLKHERQRETRFDESDENRCPENFGLVTPEQSDRLYRFAYITALAESIFGSDEKAMQWLSKPSDRFSGKSPLSILTTTQGASQVEEMLMQLAEGFAF
jgi:putative toxin-antitoxin system antitoxin component (TIGR02293 family)